MKVKFIENEMTYLIANHGVAKNAIFRVPYFRKRLESKINRYLSPLCDVLGIAIHRDQFQIVVRMASRERFVSYYTKKRLDQGKEIGSIPESTYIFSQAMANLQSSAAIHFNRRVKRTGAVFARRFLKLRIDGEDELRSLLARLKKKVKLHRYEGEWSCERGVVYFRRFLDRRKGFKKGKKLSEGGSNVLDLLGGLQGRFAKTLNSSQFLNSSRFAPP